MCFQLPRDVRVLLVGLMLVLTTGCTSANLLGPEASQGIDGIVLIGPQCPVVSEQNPCPDLPYAAWIDVVTSEGASVTRIRSGEDGRFRVGLIPGAYVLRPESGVPFPTAGDVSVTVTADVWADVTVGFDTGIR
jgi:hypothetical protein